VKACISGHNIGATVTFNTEDSDAPHHPPAKR
jgi:hypothetical protein